MGQSSSSSSPLGAPASRSSDEPADRCYCIFEGGGAKGLAHVGALKALEESRLELVGFAGTSAGAIVAALAAAGYRSEEVFNATGSILDQLDVCPTNIYGGAVFRPVASPPKLLGWVGWLSIRLGLQLKRYCAWIIVPLIVLGSGVLHFAGLHGEGLEFAIQTTLVALLVLLPLYFAVPAASLKGFAKGINQAIALKLKNSRDPAPITFLDLKNAGCHPLKIVAADITQRRLVLFSAEETPHVCVADAVAASACIPGIFRPWSIGDSKHVDGGIVSNVPAWAFDSERMLDRDAWTAVVEVSDKSAKHESPRGYGVIWALIDTALFGSGLLNMRNVDRLRSVGLGVNLGMLDFGLSRNSAESVVDSAYNAARERLVYQIEVIPNQIKAALEAIVRDARSLIGVALRSSGGRRRYRGHLRAALHFPIRDDPNSLLKEFSVGQKDHTDEYIRLPIDDSFVGMALTEEIPIYLDRKLDRRFWEASLNRPEHRWQRKLIWPDLQWCLCVPYYHNPSGAWLVLTLDSDRPLGLSDPEDTLYSIADQVETILSSSLPSEAFAWLS